MPLSYKIDLIMDEPNAYATAAARWTAVRDRDSAADGRFWYGVATTGIYCRPGCASRQPRRENVRTFDSPEQAEAAGFRPCKRCNPRAAQPADPHQQAIVAACRLIEAAEQPPTLADLADAAGLSKYHFHRLFKKTVGVTPRQYAAEVRRDRVRKELQKETTVTDAIYNAGYESSSRFYETAAEALGMKPKQYQRGGAGLRIQYAIEPSYLGFVLVAATERGICHIDFAADEAVLQTRLNDRFPAATLTAGNEAFTAQITAVLSFLDAPRRGLDLPLDIQGTAFQRRVWTALQQIPPGQTASYAEIAAQIGRPTAARAVARACAANTLAGAIPCHRVVRSDGTLGGYRWGIARKQALLEREADA